MQLSLFEQSTLEAIHQTGSTTGSYGVVADKLGLSGADLCQKVQRGTQVVGKWQHKVRLIQQRLKKKGLVENVSKNAWRVTPSGESLLNQDAEKPVMVYFVTKYGVAFKGDAKSVSSLFKNEIDLIVTSPPYLLASETRGYKNLGDNEKEYVDNLVSEIEAWLPCLTTTASIVINLGHSIIKGRGYQSLYKERLLIALEDKLGLHLVQKFTWYSHLKPPTGYWVTRAKRDCVNATEDFLWLSLNPKSCKANNQNIKVEYSANQKKHIKSAKRKSPTRISVKPSGNSANEKTFYRDNGGAIPSNLIFSAHEPANSLYSRYCKENDLPRHPAMFNHEIPEFFIRYLTDRGDFVFDPFSGSGNTAFAAEALERHWVSSEVDERYIDGHIGRMKTLN